MALIQTSFTALLDGGLRVDATVEVEGTDSQLLELSTRLRESLGPAKASPKALPADCRRVG